MFFKRVNQLWQRAGGGVLAPCVLTVLILTWFTLPGLNPYAWLLWLHWPLLMFHEFEEYVFPGGFKEFLNAKTPLAHTPPLEDVPLNEPYVFAVNIGLWAWIIAGALLAPVAPWVGLGPVLLQLLVNNITHTVAFQTRQRGYNPGLLTTIFVLMPYCTLVIWYIIFTNRFTPLDWVLGIASGLAVPAILLTITRTRNKRASQQALARG